MVQTPPLMGYTGRSAPVPRLRSEPDKRPQQMRYRRIRAKRHGENLFDGGEAEISPIVKGIFPAPEPGVEAMIGSRTARSACPQSAKELQAGFSRRESDGP